MSDKMICESNTPENDKQRGELSSLSAAAGSVWGRLQAIADGLEELGFELSRGTWEGGFDEVEPTLNITRPSCQEWAGVWSTHEDDEDAVAVLLIHRAINEWDEYENAFLPND